MKTDWKTLGAKLSSLGRINVVEYEVQYYYPLVERVRKALDEYLPKLVVARDSTVTGNTTTVSLKFGAARR